MAVIVEGKKLAEELRAGLRREVGRLAEAGCVPGLAVVLVGDDPASLSYVTGKERACRELGMRSFEHRLPASTGQTELVGLIERLNADPAVHAILVQSPVPAGLDEAALNEAVLPEKDVDCLHPYNVGRMFLGRPLFLPCTPHGILKILESERVKLEGSQVVVVGRSAIVGRPIAAMLAAKRPGANATVTVCHTGTPDLGRHTRQADVLIAAAGRPGLIKADMLKPGAVVIDVGVSRVPDPSKKAGYRLVGDVDFEGAREKASLITPVPGGVGPLTITMLLHNTVMAAARALDKEGRR